MLPALLTPAGAGAYLRAQRPAPPALATYRLPTSGHAAAAYLRAHWNAPVALEALYPVLFPALAAADPTPSAGAGPIRPRDVAAAAAIHARLFPLNAWWLDVLETAQDPDPLDEESAAELQAAADRLEIELYGVDFDGEVSWPWAGLLLLLGEIDADSPYLECYGAPPPPPALVAALAAAATPDPADPADARLARVVALGAPFSGLPAALAMLAHTTGSVFLDAGAEDTLDFTWCAGDVVWLHAQWQRARTYLAQVDPLLDWLAADPAHWAPLLAAWRGPVPPPAPPPADRRGTTDPTNC